ncbi:MAG: putative recombination protein [Prokaryotic dsDNA virus sp.]|nr:MAG: putative recombination protein [Prokaryotic dsDNA virus sp.]|tara:strand:- start:22654 stop:23496 length:843 start_codon:yes stop_codon:yes gene_type:complete
MNQLVTQTQHTKAKAVSLVERFGQKFGVEPAKFWATLKSTAFRGQNGQPPSDSEMMALLVVADQYGLNPFTREIYAFPDKKNGIVPVVGVDGWIRICNENPAYDGIEFRYSDEMATIDEHHKPCPAWCEAIIYRKDRSRPIIAREDLDEVYREPFKKGDTGYVMMGPWQTHTKRFLRHKALIQTARIAFGFAGIYDEDEASAIAADFRVISDPAQIGHDAIEHDEDGVINEDKPAKKSKPKAADKAKDAPEAEADETEASEGEEAEPAQKSADESFAMDD